ncbi:MAG: PspC domain-containing protein [Peptococcaceae bacterium]|nr:PspC domain-containing protein [Candidatus Syntrophopropionicum ammoniitolerans]
MQKLYRSRKTRLIAGVAGGLAEYFDIDVAIIRLLWVLAAFAGGAGLLAYIAAMIIIPERRETLEKPGEGQQEGVAKPKRSHRLETARRNAGLILIGLGVLLLAHEILPWYLMRYVWPLLLIGLGVFVLSRGRQGGRP